VEGKNFDTGLAGIEYGFVLERTGHFALQAAGTFVRIDVQDFLHVYLL
jgi:hypothetical protein